MRPGEVVLLDTYSVLHGRETFQGPRPHAEKHTHEHVRGYESGFVEKSPAKRTRANVLSW